MQRTIIFAALAIYIVGFGLLRVCCGESGMRTCTDSQGVYHEQHLKGTHLLIPRSGLLSGASGRMSGDAPFIFPQSRFKKQQHDSKNTLRCGRINPIGCCH